jgi:lysozyme
MNYEKLFDQIKQCEGIRLSPYRCSRGYWTIGIGRNLQTNPLSKEECIAIFGVALNPDQVIEKLKHNPLTYEQAEMLFIKDMEEVEEACYRNIHMNGNDARRAAIINMVFQLGLGGVLGFKKTIAYYESGEFELCAMEMLDSKWAKKDTPSRANLVSEQMRTGEWQ